MRTRTAVSTFLTLACLAFAGCGGGSSQKAETPKAEELTDAEKAAFEAESAKVADEEKAHQAKLPPETTDEDGSDEEKRAAKQKKKRK